MATEAPPHAPAPTRISSPSLRILQDALGPDLIRASEFRGDLAMTVSRSAWVKAATLLRDHPECDFKLFLDLCAVDYLDRPDAAERYEVVLHLYSVSGRHHIRLKTKVPEAEPKLDTLTGVYRGANWFEREAWDLYGIVFNGHPKLERLLTHDSFVGHPMRKDYPTARRHVLKQPNVPLLHLPPHPARPLL